MAFFGRVGNILRQAANKQLCSELRSTPSIFQAIRCMSSATSTKLFIGGEFCLLSLFFSLNEPCLCFLSHGMNFPVVGLSYNTDEQSLRETFAKYGEVVDGN